jgi:hypothetical protein
MFVLVQTTKKSTCCQGVSKSDEGYSTTTTHNNKPVSQQTVKAKTAPKICGGASAGVWRGGLSTSCSLATNQAASKHNNCSLVFCVSFAIPVA